MTRPTRPPVGHDGPMRIGLPRMHKEAGERRDFPPAFVAALCRDGATEVILEDGYGAGMRVPRGAYEGIGGCVRFAGYDDVLDQDVVVVIRCPDDDAIRRMHHGSLLVSMLHFPTRPWRVRLLDSLGIDGLSLESVKDDVGRRLVENLRAVGWNGVEAAFKELAKAHTDFAHPSRRPVRVTCLGSGAVGGFATHAATRYGDPHLREELVAKSVPGVEVTVVDFDLTWHEDYMLDRLERTDLLIDATHRIDPSVPVVPNAWLAALPGDAILLDLASDPYLPEADPPMVKGLEGIPQGNLDQWVFPLDDPAWERHDPGVDATHRRTAVSCYAWPGVHPCECMEVYGSQIEPLMALILRTPIGRWDAESGPHEERAAMRGALSTWRAMAAA
jgi:alanine dehydrogenase